LLIFKLFLVKNPKKISKRKFAKIELDSECQSPKGNDPLELKKHAKYLSASPKSKKHLFYREKSDEDLKKTPNVMIPLIPHEQNLGRVSFSPSSKTRPLDKNSYKNLPEINCYQTSQFQVSFS